MPNYEMTVMVACYNPEWKTLQYTLKSILLQRNCSYKIVITDDGSNNNLFSEIKEYFRNNSFNDYELVTSKENHGTVRNVLQGLNLCEGAYVKGLGQGDMLHGFFALRDWIDYMRGNPQVVMSFCDAIVFQWKDKEFVAESHRAHPQRAFIGSKGDGIKEYLLYGDLCLGTVTMYKPEVVIPYLERMRDKVIYVDDFVWRLMCYSGEKFSYYKQSSILYEYGSGISTSGRKTWREKMQKDFAASNRVILEGVACQAAREKHVPEFLSSVNSTDFWGHLKQLWMCPSYLFFALQWFFWPRRTLTTIDEKFVQELLM